MGWVATPELVAASCNAGAFGFLALATAGPDEAIEMIDIKDHSEMVLAEVLTIINEKYDWSVE